MAADEWFARVTKILLQDYPPVQIIQQTNDITNEPTAKKEVSKKVKRGEE